LSLQCEDQSVASELNQRIQQLLKVIRKKNNATRVKSLLALLSLARGQEELSSFLSMEEKKNLFWEIMRTSLAPLFNQLQSDSLYRLRELSLELLYELVRFNKSFLARDGIIKEMASAWIISMFDPEPSVHPLATKSFQEAFPSVAKQSQLIRLCKTELLDFLSYLDDTGTLKNEIVSFKKQNTQDSSELLASQWNNIGSRIFILKFVLSIDPDLLPLDNYLGCLMTENWWSFLLKQSDSALIRTALYGVLKQLLSFQSLTPILNTKILFLTVDYLFKKERIVSSCVAALEFLYPLIQRLKGTSYYSTLLTQLHTFLLHDRV
jgi:hypothetical protein